MLLHAATEVDCDAAGRLDERGALTVIGKPAGQVADGVAQLLAVDDLQRLAIGTLEGVAPFDRQVSNVLVVLQRQCLLFDPVQRIGDAHLVSLSLHVGSDAPSRAAQLLQRAAKRHGLTRAGVVNLWRDDAALRHATKARLLTVGQGYDRHSTISSRC